MFPDDSWLECRNAPNADGHYYGSICESTLLHVPSGIFGGLFTLLFVAHLGLAVIHKRRICWSLVTAALLSAVGYWLKLANAVGVRNRRHVYRKGWSNDDKVADSLFKGYYICVFLAVFSLNIYLYTLLHLLRRTYIMPTKRFRSRLYALFSLDISANVTVIVAVSYQVFIGGGDGLGYTWASMIFGGSIVQILNYLFFLGLLLEFQIDGKRRQRKERLVNELQNVRSGIEGGIAAATETDNQTPRRKYKWMLIALYTSTILLIIRSIYYALLSALPGRFFPKSKFYDHRDPSHSLYGEWEFKFWEQGQYGLDATMVFLCLVILALPWCHPGKVLPKSRGWSMTRRRGAQLNEVKAQRGLELHVQRGAPPEYVVESGGVNGATSGSQTVKA